MSKRSKTDIAKVTYGKSQQIEYKKRVRVSIAHGHVLVHVADLNLSQFPTFRKKDMLA